MSEVAKKYENHSEKTDELYSSVRGALPEFFECLINSPESIQVNTPLMYADGGGIEVYVLENENQVVVSDVGEALSWLSVTTGQSCRTPEQTRFIEDLCRLYGIELYQSELIRELESYKDLMDAVIRIAQAVARISDLYYKLPIRITNSVDYRVQDWLSERNLKFNLDVERSGQSGRKWTINYQTEVDDCQSFIFLLSPNSMEEARLATEHVYTGCGDLKDIIAKQSKSQLVSLFDDTVNLWYPEDFKLLEKQSLIARWSQPEELEKILRGAHGKG